MVLRAMIDFDNVSPGGGGGVASITAAEPQRGRFRSRLQNKGGLLQPPSPSLSEISATASPRSNFGIGELNRRIIDLKMDNCNSPLTPPPLCSGSNMGDNSTKLSDMSNYQNPNNSHYQPTTQTQLQLNALQQQIRRDSNNSTTSSSYYSMKSSDISRRSSQQSHTSTNSTIRPNNGNYINYGNVHPSSASFYDPISPGSSRRSSQLSTITSDGTAGNMGSSPPSSQLLSSHLARLQQYSYYNNSQMSNSQYFNPNNFLDNQMHHAQHNFGLAYNQQQHMQPFTNQQAFYNNMPYQASSGSDRRMSEPISRSRSMDNESQQELPPRPRSATPTKSLEMLLDTPTQSQVKVASKKPEKVAPEEHPNREVVLDALTSDEKIENKLVIPDDMLSYLAQVDCEDSPNQSEKPPINVGDELIVDQLMTSLDIDKLKEEDLLLFLNEVDGDPEKSKTEEESNTEQDTSKESFANKHKKNDKDDDQDGDTKKVSNSSPNNSDVSKEESHNQQQQQQQREDYSDNSEINNNISSNNNDNVDSHNCKEEVDSTSDCSKLLYKTHASIYILSMET